MTTELLLGLVTGILFGIFLQQGRVLRFEKQVGAMLFRDMTIFKFMLSAIIVGMIGINLLVDLGMVEHKIKSTVVAANLVGGLLFGAGWAIMGYCPGTSVGAIAEGRWHAAAAVFGMLVGAALYAEATPLLASNLLVWGDFGKITLASVLGISPWIVIPIFIAVFVAMFVVFERRGI